MPCKKALTASRRGAVSSSLCAKAGPGRDAGFKARCEERYRQLHADGHSTILVSHDPRIVRDFCDRALLLHGGRIVAEGAGDEIAAEYQRRLVQTPAEVREAGA